MTLICPYYYPTNNLNRSLIRVLTCSFFTTERIKMPIQISDYTLELWLNFMSWHEQAARFADLEIHLRYTTHFQLSHKQTYMLYLSISLLHLTKIHSCWIYHWLTLHSLLTFYGKLIMACLRKWSSVPWRLGYWLKDQILIHRSFISFSHLSQISLTRKVYCCHFSGNKVAS